MYFRNDIDPDNLEHEQSAGFLRDKLLQVFISTKTFGTNSEIYMSHFAYAWKMRYPLNLVLENSEYLGSIEHFCIVILDYGLKLHKLSNHILGMLQK